MSLLSYYASSDSLKVRRRCHMCICHQCEVAYRKSNRVFDWLHRSFVVSLANKINTLGDTLRQAYKYYEFTDANEAGTQDITNNFSLEAWWKSFCDGMSELSTFLARSNARCLQMTMWRTAFPHHGVFEH